MEQNINFKGVPRKKDYTSGLCFAFVNEASRIETTKHFLRDNLNRMEFDLLQESLGKYVYWNMTIILFNFP